MKHLPKTICLLLAAMLLLTALPAPVQAGSLAGNYAYVVRTSWLNLRAGPGLQYDILGKALRGEMIDILSYEGGGTWVSVRVMSSGQVGFMDSSYLASAPEDVPPTPITPTPVYPGPIYPGPGSPTNRRAVVRNPVATQFLNLRQYASYAAPVLGIYYNGTQFTVLSESGGWYYVLMDTGLRGYFRSEFVSFDLSHVDPGLPVAQGTAKIVSSGGRVNLRQGPGYSYPVIASYYPGKTVTVYSKNQAFWQISVDGVVGFMDRKFLSTSGSGGGSTSGTNATVRSGARLNLRQQPSTSAKVLGQYPAGTAVRVTRQGTEWCAVTIPSTGATGYFMTRYLNLRGLPEMPTKIVKNASGGFVYMRARATKNAQVITKVPHNSVITVLIPAGTWSRVRFGSTNGWMMSTFLK